MPNSPLITLAILTYNQENFIQDAIKGALEQTYSPLEILISDDNSTDSTFDKIISITKDYKGPHKITINRNDKNLGLCNHINFVTSQAQGKWIVANAGDDCSEPNRVKEIYNYIELSNKTLYYIFSNYYPMENDLSVKENPPNLLIDNKDYYKNLENGFKGINGATEVWSKEMFEIFGPLSPDNFVEDKPLAFRSMLLSKELFFLDKPLLKYRKHDSNLSITSIDKSDIKLLMKHLNKWYIATEKIYDQYLIDLNTAFKKNIIDSSNYNSLKNGIERLKISNEYKYKLDMYWLNAIEVDNIIKLSCKALINGVSLRFIMVRLFKKIKNNLI